MLLSLCLPLALMPAASGNDKIFINRYFGGSGCGLAGAHQHMMIEQLAVGCTAAPAEIGGMHRLLYYDPLANTIQRYAERCTPDCARCELTTPGNKPFRAGDCSVIGAGGSVLIYAKAKPCFGVAKYSPRVGTFYSTEYPAARRCDDNRAETAIHLRPWMNVTGDMKCRSDSGAPGSFYAINRTNTAATTASPAFTLITGRINCTSDTCEDCNVTFAGPEDVCLPTNSTGNGTGSAVLRQSLESCAMAGTLPPSPPSGPDNDDSMASRQKTAVIIGATLAGGAGIWLLTTFVLCRKSIQDAERRGGRIDLLEVDPADYGTYIEA